MILFYFTIVYAIEGIYVQYIYMVDILCKPWYTTVHLFPVSLLMLAQVANLRSVQWQPLHKGYKKKNPSTNQGFLFESQSINIQQDIIEFIPYFLEPLDVKKIKRLGKIIKLHSAKIVLAKVWRISRGELEGKK